MSTDGILQMVGTFIGNSAPPSTSTDINHEWTWKASLDSNLSYSTLYRMFVLGLCLALSAFILKSFYIYLFNMCVIQSTKTNFSLGNF